MARAALGLGVRELAAAANVSPDTVARLERGDELRENTIKLIREALENAGVAFVGDGEVSERGGPGVRFATKRKGKRR